MSHRGRSCFVALLSAVPSRQLCLQVSCRMVARRPPYTNNISALPLSFFLRRKKPYSEMSQPVSPQISRLRTESHAAAAAAKSLQSCPTLGDPHRRQPTRLPRPWDSPGKNTGVGCHFLLQCMKGKSESEVAQSCPILRDPMDCSLPGSSIHGISQARVLE